MSPPGIPDTEIAPPQAATQTRDPWLTPGVRGLGAASLLADLGHEVPTALLPSFLTSTSELRPSRSERSKAYPTGFPVSRDSRAERSPMTPPGAAPSRSAATRAPRCCRG
jgi:hypothetical protein